MLLICFLYSRCLFPNHFSTLITVIFFSIDLWICFLGHSAVAERVLWSRVCPSFCPSFRSSVCRERFLGIVSLVFLKFWPGARNPYEVVRDSRIFQKKSFCPQIRKMEKWSKNEPETGFFEFIVKFCHQFLLNLFYNENLYYFLCSCTNPIFGKIFVSKIWAKMFSVNQIISRTNQWNSLIFYMLMQVYVN